MATSLHSTSGAFRWLVPGLVLAALAGMNLTSALLLPPTDGDLGWQHWLGMRIVHGGLPHALGAESFAAPGSHWVPQEWLFCTLLAAASTHGLSPLFAGAVAACTVLALGCVAVRCARHGAQPLPIAFVLVFVDVAMMQSFGVRVQVIGWALLAAFLVALELPARYRWTAVAVAALWANWHASAVLAPALATAAAVGNAVQLDPRAALRDGRLALCSAIAVCLTPLGLALPVYAVTLGGSPVRHWIREWHATSLADPSFVFGALPVMALALLAAPRGSRRAFAIAAPFAYLALAATRNIPLAAIACAPLAAKALTDLIPTLAAFRPRVNRTATAGALALVFGAAATATAFGAHGARDTRPLAAIAQLAAASGPHRLLCEDFAWCGPALDTGAISVFVDGRADPFPVAVWAEYDAVIRVHRGWNVILRRRGVDALLVRRGSELDRAARRDNWHIARDGSVRLLARYPQVTSTARIDR